MSFSDIVQALHCLIFTCQQHLLPLTVTYHHLLQLAVLDFRYHYFSDRIIYFYLIFYYYLGYVQSLSLSRYEIRIFSGFNWRC